MKVVLSVGAVGALLLSSPVVGQPVVGQPAVGKVGVARALQGSYAASKANLTSEADKMPDAEYRLRPGTMPEVRTFGQLFAHTAAGQFGIRAAVKGVPNPVANRNVEQELTTKAEFVKVLAESFVFCDDVFSSTTDENAMQFIKQGPNELPRAAVLFGLLAHNSEM